jgi:hypothetical protein
LSSGFCVRQFLLRRRERSDPKIRHTDPGNFIQPMLPVSQKNTEFYLFLRQGKMQIFTFSCRRR